MHNRVINQRRKRSRRHSVSTTEFQARQRRFNQVIRPNRYVRDRPKDLFAQASIARSYRKNSVEIKVPAHLDLAANAEEFFDFLARFREVCCDDPVSRVFIKHADLQSITPDAALVLIAEFTRAHAYAPECSKHCDKPLNPDCVAMLRKIGYFRYLPGMEKDNWITQGKMRRFFAHVTQTRLAGAVVDKLLSHFDATAAFQEEERKELYKALVDCMDNTLGHAYPAPSSGLRYLYKRWWLLGGCDDDTKEIFFAFYDQGMGIPGTIRTRFRDRLPALNLIGGRTDEQIIVKAVIEGAYSRHQSKERGRGLPQLKAFIDTAPHGELVIVSNRSRCIFRRSVEPTAERLGTLLPGTLVTWSLKR